MSRVAEVVRGIATRPVEAIEAVIALTLFFFGLYMVSPFYVATSTGALSVAFGSDILLRVVVAVPLYIAPTLITITSLFTRYFNSPAWRARANLGMFIGVIFLTLLRLLTIGLFPMIWLFTLALGLISALCYLYWRSK